VASHWQTLSHNGVLNTPRLSGIRTNNVCGDRLPVIFLLLYSDRNSLYCLFQIMHRISQFSKRYLCFNVRLSMIFSIVTTCVLGELTVFSFTLKSLYFTGIYVIHNIMFEEVENVHVHFVHSQNNDYKE
jgi:hypothetical protein